MTKPRIQRRDGGGRPEFTEAELASILRIESAFLAYSEGRHDDVPADLVTFVGSFGRDREASWKNHLVRTIAINKDRLNQPDIIWHIFPSSVADIERVIRARPGR